MLYPSLSFRNSTWTPAQLTTALWLDAADASTVTTVSGAVSQWDDKSGSGNHVTQANSALRPIYQSSVLNSLPVVRFDGSDDQLATSAAVLTQQVFGIYSVTANRNPSGESAVMGQYINGDPGRTFVYQNGVSTRLAAIFSGYGNANYNGTANSSFHIFGYEAIGLTYSLFYEAVNQASGSITGTSISNTTFKIGEPAGGTGGVYFPAFLDAAEIVVALAPLSTTDRQKLEGYLAHKWGLAGNLPVGHPYKNKAP
ncbi:MAG: hypothetical protein ACO33E_00145 [Aquiluna sp.]